MKFIDLFAGLGGFHVGLSRLGHECVFASELNEALRIQYEHNFDLECKGNICAIASTDIPNHDILCAGFPCQSFSQAGPRGGLSDPRGDLFFEISRIIAHHKPKYFILENVPNLLHHDDGRTFEIIKETLEKDLNYFIKYMSLSPHDFGVPQKRKRIFIVGSKHKTRINNFSFPQPNGTSSSLMTILDHEDLITSPVEDRQLDCINLWQEIINAIPKNIKLPSPIWSTEFGATYPFEQKVTTSISTKKLKQYRGSFGISLEGKTRKEIYNCLPTYATNTDLAQFQIWKKRYISVNRKFYLDNKISLKPFLKKLKKLPHSWQKFEWNCNGETRNFSEHILQFRSSGLRVKRSDTSPSLIASTVTQLPIIGKNMRYISLKEASKLQSLETITLPKNKTLAFKSLGNAVNAKLVELIASKFY